MGLSVKFVMEESRIYLIVGSLDTLLQFLCPSETVYLQQVCGMLQKCLFNKSKELIFMTFS